MNMQRIKILNVNDSIDLKSGGGTAERTFQMSRHLALAGAECHVLAIASDTLDDSRIDALRPASATILKRVGRRFRVPLFSWPTVKWLVNDADIVHLMGHWSVLNVMACLAARRAGKPYVVCPAGSLPAFGRSRHLKAIFNALVGKAMVRNAAGWIAVTASELPQFEKYGVKPERVEVIPNGVDAQDFPYTDTATFRNELGIPLGSTLLLFMGRLNPIKGPDLLLEAFIQISSRHETAHLVFAGPEGGMGVALQARVQAAGLAGRVHFLGHVEGMRKVAAYRAANMLVVPSRLEAMSIVAVEAGFCGTLAVVTDQCGLSEIKAVDPVLEAPATARGLADAIGQLLQRPGGTHAVALQWQAFVTSRFGWPLLVPRYLAYYASIIARDNIANRDSHHVG